MERCLKLVQTRPKANRRTKTLQQIRPHPKPKVMLEECEASYALKKITIKQKYLNSHLN